MGTLSLMQAPQNSGYLDETKVSVIAQTGGARPHIVIEGEVCVINARLRRCFPLTSSGTHICVLDSESKEMGLIGDLALVDRVSRAIIEQELDSFYFTPAIDRIVSLKQEASMWKWEVSTQRGNASFYLRGVRDSVHEVAPQRWQVYSVDGQRYEIRNLDDLDQRSQNLFESLF